jgi:molecular chaperone DnaJ
LTIQLEDAFYGKTFSRKIQKQSSCRKCNGIGAEPGSDFKTCPTCNGSGAKITQVRTMLGVFQQRTTCETCKGDGKVPERICVQCNGLGVERREEEVEFEIPKGIHDGQTLELSMKGHAAPFGGRAGNLYISIHISKDKNLVRKGNDLQCVVKVPFTELIFGTEVDIRVFKSTLQMKVPSGTPAGEVFRLRGKGMPIIHGGSRYGDLYVTIQVELSRKSKQ